MVDQSFLHDGLDFMAGKVGGIGSIPLTAPTPCREWELGALLNHVIATTTLLSRIAAGHPVEAEHLAPAATAATAFTGEPEQAFAKAAALARETFADPGGWERTVAMPTGAEFPGAVLAKLIALDAVAHGWDIARATGQDDTLPAPLVDTAMAFATDFVRPEVRGTTIGHQVHVGPAATKTERFVAFLGRQP
ncbi:TIGR03086 family metal-binding protein [Salinactinospora qingdaonensis]|uniref:TIGR03086 family metal-binding protein n=1 Tax=Salinactinospora qingdaonensis TaxID=702744 RepID=A0ABP7FQ48_9ACTN